MPFDPTVNFPSSPSSNRGFQYPQSGPNNTAEYMASGLPFSKEVAVLPAASGSQQIDFPFVTSEIYVKNRSANPLCVGWTDVGVRTVNRHVLLQNEAVTFRVRVKSVFLFGVSGSTTADLTAAMTMIPKKSFPALTGSAANPDTGGFGFNSGSLERIWGYEGIG